MSDSNQHSIPIARVNLLPRLRKKLLSTNFFFLVACNTIFWRLHDSTASLPIGDYHISIIGVGAQKSYTVRLVDSVVEKAEAGASSSKMSSVVVAVIVVASIVVAAALVGVLVFVLIRRRRSQQRSELHQGLQAQ